MFFTTESNLPEGVGFSTFGLTHLCWLAVGAVAIALASILYRRLNEKKKKVMLCVLGGYIVFQEMLKNVVLILAGEFGYGNLPFHLCGINILLIAFDLIKPTRTVRAFLYNFCIPGALLALLFPNWTQTPFLNFFHFHSFLIHIFLVMYPALLLSAGEIAPNMKDALRSLVLLLCLAVPIYFLNLAWDTNFMFLMQPDTGNPLELFERLLGSHLWGFPILLPIVMFIMQLPFVISRRIKKKTAKE